MAESGLIDKYGAVLRAGLPPALAEEVLDGLTEAYEGCLSKGMSPPEAARTAVAEFGDPEAIVTEFGRISPARRTATSLLMTGPIVGLCWADVLISGKGWDWPVPVLARVLVGGLLLASIAGLLVATRMRRYRDIRWSGVVGSLGLATVDASMIMAVILVSPAPSSMTVVATAASAVRVMCVTRALRPMVASR